MDSDRFIIITQKQSASLWKTLTKLHLWGKENSKSRLKPCYFLGGDAENIIHVDFLEPDTIINSEYHIAADKTLKQGLYKVGFIPHEPPRKQM